MIRCRAALLVVIGALALAQSAAAETSSWVMETTEAPKPKRGRPVKLAPAPDAAKGPTFQGPATPGQSAYAKSLAPATGDEAAYIAFDQGQYLTALKLASEGVKRNDPQSHTLLGRLYAEGLGVSKEPQTAAKWYARGDELGDIQATFALGVLYAEGRGVKKDRNKSAELFEKAARTGHPLANYNLGLLFLKGDGKPQNEYRAAMHIRYAAEKGIAVAQYDMAGLYQNGSGVKPNALDAARWLSKAAEQGMAEAQFDYAVVLLRGLGLTKDEPKAIPYLRSAAQKGLASAQNRLAYVYAEGVGVKKSPQEAAKWRLIAQAGGLKDAAFDAVVAKMPKAAAARGSAGGQRVAGEGGSFLAKRSIAPCQRACLALVGAPCAACEAPKGFRPHARLSAYERDDRRRPQGWPQPRPRLRRGGAVAGVREGARQFRLGGRPQGRGHHLPRAGQGAPRLLLPHGGARRSRRRRPDASLDRRSARRHHQLSARRSAVRHLDRLGARGSDRCRRRLQSDLR